MPTRIKQSDVELAKQLAIYHTENEKKKQVTREVKEMSQGLIPQIKAMEGTQRVSDSSIAVTLPLGDGVNVIEGMVTERQTIKHVDTIIEDLRKLLPGSVFDRYVIEVPVLVNGALEDLYREGHLSDEDIESLTVVKSSESLKTTLNKKR
jgi:hypothetical protein